MFKTNFFAYNKICGRTKYLGVSAPEFAPVATPSSYSADMWRNNNSASLLYPERRGWLTAAKRDQKI